MKIRAKKPLNLLLTSCLILSITACGITSKSTSYHPSTDFKSNKNTSSNAKGTMKPYKINGKTYYPTVVEVGETAQGIASWYGPGFHGKKTSNGETYNQNDLTAAHKTLPMNTILKVTNLSNNKTVSVRINDRGPFVANRIIDLSKEAATQIDMIKNGTARVKLEVIGFASKTKTHQIIHNDVNLGKSGEIVDNGKIYEGGNFLVQIGAFRLKEGAKRVAEQYKDYKGYKTTIKTSEQDQLNRVYLSGFKSEAEAQDFAQSGEFKGAFVVRE